jgi:hypothetical protein
LPGSGLHERRRTKEAADVVGAKGWLCATAHCVCSSTVISAVAYPMGQFGRGGACRALERLDTH